jgi:hypothetical protein
MYHELLLSTIVQHKSFINVFAKEFSFNLPHKLLLSTIEQHKQNFKAKAKQSKARHYPTQKYCTMVTVYLVQLLLMISTLITAATATDDKNKNADLFDLTKYIKGEEGPVAEQYDRLRPNDNIFERNNNGNVGTRIVGGEESDIDEFPYFGTYASYCIVLYCIVLYRIVSYCIVSYCIVSYRIVSYRIVSYCIVSYRIVSCLFIHHNNNLKVSPSLSLDIYTVRRFFFRV